MNHRRNRHRRNISCQITFQPICFMKHMGTQATGLFAARYAR